MIDRFDLIRQFIALKMKYVPPQYGETYLDLWKHYEYELNHGEIAWIEMGLKVTGFVDWCWISCPQDIRRANQGDHTVGEVLYINDLVLTEPNLIWKLKRLIPKANYHAGLHGGKIHCPKGWPTYETIAA